jgi:hypothetical protein
MHIFGERGIERNRQKFHMDAHRHIFVHMYILYLNFNVGVTNIDAVRLLFSASGISPNTVSDRTEKNSPVLVLS